MKYPNDPVLEAREVTHGEYATTARLAQYFKAAVHEEQHILPPTIRESLDMISTKIARILSGDWSVKDHWEDIAGYARLVVVDLESKK